MVVPRHEIATSYRGMSILSNGMLRSVAVMRYSKLNVNKRDNDKGNPKKITITIDDAWFAGKDVTWALKMKKAVLAHFAYMLGCSYPSTELRCKTGESNFGASGGYRCERSVRELDAPDLVEDRGKCQQKATQSLDD